VVLHGFAAAWAVECEGHAYNPLSPAAEELDIAILWDLSQFRSRALLEYDLPSPRQHILIVSQSLLSHAFLGNQVDWFTGVGGTPKACILWLRMTTSGRQDDSVKHFEPRDGLYFANEYSDAVSPRTFL
jgi:hypothetical protein